MLRRLVASLAVLPLRMLCYRAATISRCLGARLSPPALPPATHQAAAARLRRVLVLCLRASAAASLPMRTDRRRLEKISLDANGRTRRRAHRRARACGDEPNRNAARGAPAARQ